MNEDDFEKIGKTVTALGLKFIRHERYAQLEEQFQLLWHRRRAELKVGRVSEARGIALVGLSGAGKTTAIDRLILSLNQKPDADTIPVISLRIPSPATLKYVGQTLLKALKYDLKTERQAWYIWDKVRYHLKARRVLFLHLDEAQDLYAKGTQRDMQSVVNMLKSLMQDREWPVGIILSGTEDLREILNFDPQLGRRLFPIEFASINEVIELDEVLMLVEAYCKAANIACFDPPPDMQFGARLIHAAAGQFGLVIEIIIGAIEAALIAGETQVDRDAFLRAYRRRTSCVNGVNPFLASDFKRIDTRKLLGRKMDGGA